MNKILATLLVSLLLITSACSSAGGLNTAVEENKIQREEDQSKSIEERQQETLEQLIQDGAYIEEVTYNTPGGPEVAKITFQVKDDIVDKLEIELIGNPKDISKRYAEQSEEALQDLLIGKNVNEVELPTAIGGSSLTTTAFKQYAEDLYIRY